MNVRVFGGTWFWFTSARRFAHPLARKVRSIWMTNAENEKPTTASTAVPRNQMARTRGPTRQRRRREVDAGGSPGGSSVGSKLWLMRRPGSKGRHRMLVFTGKTSLRYDIQ